MIGRFYFAEPHWLAIARAIPGYVFDRNSARFSDGDRLFCPLSVWFDQRGRPLTILGAQYPV